MSFADIIGAVPVLGLVPMIQEIRLQRGIWCFDDSKPIGQPGGFGEVFLGNGEIGNVAIKRLKLTADHAAHRELEIGNSLLDRALEHIVPVLDIGQDAQSNRYFLVMPVCEFSLQDQIVEVSSRLDEDEICRIACNIVSGLCEVSDVTHRDLKPSNILRHNGTWKIADFGIAKFVEDSTSLASLRGHLTPAYAAPEQWLGERPTSATDVYALGCIVYAMFAGSPPFSGTSDDIREGHLRTPAPKLSKSSPRIAQFTAQMLRKVPSARPTLKRCLEVLSSRQAETPTTRAFGQLADAASIIAMQIAEQEVEARRARKRLQTMRALLREARTEIMEIRNRLFQHIRAQGEMAEIRERSLLLGCATLNFSADNVRSISGPNLAILLRAPSPGDYDVIGGCDFSLTSIKGKLAYYTCAATLFFACAPNDTSYRWYEVAFHRSTEPKNHEPYAVSIRSSEFRAALNGAMRPHHVAYGPVPIDAESEENFVERWVGLLAKSAVGDLFKPDDFPITRWPW